MCNKTVDNYSDALGFVPKCFMSHNMCDKTVNTYPSAIKLVPECFMTQEMCDKPFNRCFFFVFRSILHRYKTQGMCDTVVSEYRFLIVYCFDK